MCKHGWTALPLLRKCPFTCHNFTCKLNILMCSTSELDMFVRDWHFRLAKGKPPKKRISISICFHYLYLYWIGLFSHVHENSSCVEANDWSTLASVARSDELDNKKHGEVSPVQPAAAVSHIFLTLSFMNSAKWCALTLCHTYFT